MIGSFDCHQCCDARNKNAGSILIDVAKCPVKYRRKTFILTLELALVASVSFFKLALGLLFVVPLRSICPYLSPDVNLVNLTRREKRGHPL